MFTKGMKPTKGFTGKKHTRESKRKMSEARRANHPTKRPSLVVPDAE